MDRLRTAVVGFGKMGVLHGALARATSLADVVVIVDKSQKVGKAVKKAFRDKVVVVTDLEGLRDLDLDAVYVTTPIPSHYDVTFEVIDAGIKGIFVEKTLSDDARKSEMLVEKTSARDIVTAVGYQKRFVPTLRYLKNLLEEETLGAVESIHAYAYSEDFLAFEHRKSQSVALSRGGVLRDLGAHAIDMAVWLLDCEDPCIVNAGVSGNFPNDEVMLTFVANNADLVVSTSWCKAGYRAPEVGFELTCSKGQAFVTDDEVLIKKGSEEKKIYRVQFSEKVEYLLASPEYFLENKAFLKSVDNNKRFPGADFKEASVVDEILSKALVCLHASSSRR